MRYWGITSTSYNTVWHGVRCKILGITSTSYNTGWHGVRCEILGITSTSYNKGGMESGVRIGITSTV